VQLWNGSTLCVIDSHSLTTVVIFFSLRIHNVSVQRRHVDTSNILAQESRGRVVYTVDLAVPLVSNDSETNASLLIKAHTSAEAPKF